MEFVRIDETTFQHYASGAPHHNIWQSTMMCHLRESNGWQTHYVALREQDTIIAACALVSYRVFGDYALFQAIRGFLLDYHDTALLERFSHEVIAYIKNNKGIHFSMDPYVMVHQRDKYGALMENGENNEALVSLFQRLGYTHLGFDVEEDEEIREPRWMYVLPIADFSEAELLKNMNQLTRRSIKKTQRSGFSLVELSRAELGKFRDIITQTAKRKGFSDRSLTYYETMYDLFSPQGNIKYWLIVLDVPSYLAELAKEREVECRKLAQFHQTLAEHGDNEKTQNKVKSCQDHLASLDKKTKEVQALQERHGNEIVLSGAMFLLYGDEVIYLSGGSYEDTLTYSAQYRLQWEMIAYARNHGYKRYNFYGISGHFDNKDGVLSFKQGFGGEIHELIGTFETVVNPLVYRLYQVAKGCKQRLKGGRQ